MYYSYWEKQAIIKIEFLRHVHSKVQKEPSVGIPKLDLKIIVGSLATERVHLISRVKIFQMFV